jgi:glycosyltransferase involved in cell wall biosynthesis
MKTILATAYAINPFKGSEDGMGWNFVIQIARFNKVIAITRENNRPHIERYIAENPDSLYDNIQFLYFDLPYWMRFWKKGGQGAMLYYLMWQRGIMSFIKNQNLKFDIVHNLNFHNDWTPSFLWKLNKPFVWGPVGHHPLIPAQYLQPFANKYRIIDRLTWMVKQFFWKISPALHNTVKNADHILCMNNSVPNILGIQSNYSIAPSVATQDFGWNEFDRNKDKFTLISAGRFVPLKGFDLTICAYSEFLKGLEAIDKENCELLLIGSGPEEGFLRSLVNDLKLADRVTFISWIERGELMAKFKDASAFLFPSHEGAGMVVAEALSFGLPVICLDNEGPGQFISKENGFAIPMGDYKQTVDGLAAAIQELHASPQKRKKMGIAARKQFENFFHWDRRGEQLQKVYADI